MSISSMRCNLGEEASSVAAVAFRVFPNVVVVADLLVGRLPGSWYWGGMWGETVSGGLAAILALVSTDSFPLIPSCPGTHCRVMFISWFFLIRLSICSCMRSTK